MSYELVNYVACSMNEISISVIVTRRFTKTEGMNGNRFHYIEAVQEKCRALRVLAEICDKN